SQCAREAGPGGTGRWTAAVAVRIVAGTPFRRMRRAATERRAGGTQEPRGASRRGFSLPHRKAEGAGVVTLWGRLYAGQRCGIPRRGAGLTSVGRDAPGPTEKAAALVSSPLWGRLYAGQRCGIPPRGAGLTSVGRDEPGPTEKAAALVSSPCG